MHGIMHLKLIRNCYFCTINVHRIYIHLKMSAPMWKSEVEKYIKLLENSAVEALSNGVLNYE